MRRTSSLMVVAALFAMVIATTAFAMTKIQPATSPTATVMVDLAIQSNDFGTVETMSPLPWWAPASEVAAITDKDRAPARSNDSAMMGATTKGTQPGTLPTAAFTSSPATMTTSDLRAFKYSSVELRRDLRRLTAAPVDYPLRR